MPKAIPEMIKSRVIVQWLQGLSRVPTLPCLLRVVGSCSDFYTLLFGIWCVSRRSKKIRNGLELCVEKLVQLKNY
jgi:hypothetical protein